MLTCVILNYNDYESVILLYEKIKSYEVIDLFILVDNLSTDNSFEKLKKLENKKTKVIKSDKNGGYGYGNNIGLRYSKEVNADYAIVCNPDTEFSEKAIVNSLKIIKDNEKCVAVSPKVNIGDIAYKFATPFGEICYSSLLLNKIVKARSYPYTYFLGKEIVNVDVIPGSFTIFDINKFIDEEFFLYHEEIVIGTKFKNSGYIQQINMNEEYIHKHHISVNKTYKSEIQVKKMVLKSHRLYMKKYLKVSKLTLFLFDFMRPINLLELFIWSNLKKMITKLKS